MQFMMLSQIFRSWEDCRVGWRNSFQLGWSADSSMSGCKSALSGKWNSSELNAEREQSCFIF